MSAFVDNFLAPIVRTGCSFIRDTSDFLLKLQDIRDLCGDEILLTLGVSSLYTNIPNKEGTMATLRALRQARPGATQPSNLSLIEMLAQVLSYNNFQFDGKNYLQIGGTAMGTRVAPSYANIFMNGFEEKHVYTHHLEPLAWYSYIDDIFCLWQHGEEVEKFTTHLNSVHETIKFTIEKWRTSVSFLDTEVHLDNNNIHTTLYVKPTDRNNYLPLTLHIRTTARRDCLMASSYAYGEYAARKTTTIITAWKRQPYLDRRATHSRSLMRPMSKRDHHLQPSL